MKQKYAAFVLAAVLAALSAVSAQSATAGQGTAMGRIVKVRMQTSMGAIVLDLYPDKAPLTVANFLAYVEAGAYDGTVFHRVIPGFMIQGGGFNPDMSRRPTLQAVRNEADNGLKNLRGSIAMARTNDPNSATNQFFINTVNNSFLDFTARTANGWGYAVFGQVSEGLDVVLAIEKVRTTTRGAYADVPVEAVSIQQVRVLK